VLVTVRAVFRGTVLHPMLSADRQGQAGGDARFRLAMASSGIGMAIVDLDGRWSEVNPAFERMFGHAAAEVVGQPVAMMTHPDDRAASDDALRGLIGGVLPTLDAEMRYLHRDGHAVWTHVNVAVMRGADGEPACLIAQLRDITAQRAAEAALRDCNAELERINRQRELFAYGVSHDLRAPLRAIDSFAALVAGQYGDRLDDTGRDYLDRIRNAAARMSGLIDSLLELSRADRSELKSEIVDLSLLAEWVGAELQDAEPSRAADIAVQPGLLVRGDERHLKQLLTQLLRNAWTFSRDRDRVRIAVTGERRGDRLQVSVRDEGTGFDMRYAERMFEPFQRLHGPEQGGGHGLGLTIAQRIAQRHGGRVWADSESGVGSVFHVDLPAADDNGRDT